MRVPTSKEVQEIATRKVGLWIYGECKKIWGDDVQLKEKENMKDKLEAAGYTLEKDAVGTSMTYRLLKSGVIVSSFNLNIFDLAIELANTEKATY